MRTVVERALALMARVLRHTRSTLLAVAMFAFAGVPPSTGSPATSEQLVKAIKRGDLAAVRVLLMNHANPNSTDSKGQPAITLITEAPVTGTIHAITSAKTEVVVYKHKNHAEIVMLLVKHGAKLNVKNALGQTPLMQAKACEEQKLVGFLVKAGAK